ncbi:23S rRNA (uracil(1939)-C(5))-methyltransferase RlmD [Mammaliicoccus stepanovicii]|uniref:RNA methyltransferase, TrmA family n=1 Tax=Mammaliicoccus stepanovicii TaxID=643214 RepID=A0A239YSJ7_9STAP|nr:23S rRNA (uracil(1939)-C(5))-methyltransferase RlmD [Mammaliicoccus stepanovicii]PNZ75919.1 23S rRNA (uracil(1939)-C(5))-methyltransferase RlmD [Mammaliicoccus stepanovicii]GGI42294.1 RNA methyltransferase [Mammaliicoccus stepanovicii]SNV62059.1 RNA methyltransferase, TrmA family [Mammaliicoccus stepanovicii]
MTNVVNKNETYTGQVIDFTHEGHGVVKFDRFPIFVPNAIKDETIEFKVIKVKKQFAIGKLLTIKEKSQDRIEAPCEYYKECGGCQLQHLSYTAQLEMKKEQVVNLFQRKSHFEDTVINNTIGMENPWHYRNKSQIPVQKNRQGEIELGFYRQRSHTLVDINHCMIQDKKHDQIMNKLRTMLEQLNMNIYNEQKHKGELRHIILRSGYYTEDTMIIFVTNTKQLSHKNKIIDYITNEFENVVSIKHNINQEKSNVIMGKTSYTIYGKDTIEDQLAEYQFKISDTSFYQINPQQTEKLYNKALEYAQLDGEQTVIDAYCGIGTIGTYMSQKAKHVYGVEIVEEAIKNAEENAKINHVENATWEAGKAEDIILKWKKEGIKPEVVMVDPPRKGCDQTFIETLIELSPKRIVYISCNPATQVRDVEILKEAGYNLKEITPVDMFPHTTHVETVALIEKN